MKKILNKSFISALIFLLIGIMLFGLVQTVLLDKYSYTKYRSWKAQDNVDILILGNSHANGGISPLAMEEYFSDTYGLDLSVFNYSSYGMVMEQIYFFAKELLKTHTPDLILLETFAFCPLEDSSREVLFRRAFDAYPITRNKFSAINYCVFENQWSYVFPIAKYHNRWKELTPYDFSVIFDEELWMSAGKAGGGSDIVMSDPGDGWFEQDTSGINSIREITASEKDCVEMLLYLAEKKGVDVLFVSIPYKIQSGLDSNTMITLNNYLVEHYVNGDSVHMLDLNRMWQELDIGYEDLENEGHVNRYGAEKVATRLFPYIAENFDLASYVG